MAAQDDRSDTVINRKYKVSVIDGVVRQDSGSKPYAVYKCKVECATNEWVIYRRYSDFYALNSKVAKKYGADGFMLPKKKLLGNMKAEFIEARRVSLHRYMQRVLEHPVVSKCPELVEFLAPDRVDAGGEGASEADESEARPVAPGSPSAGVLGAKMTIDDYTLIKVIGKGSFGKVMLAKKKDTGRIYAIKILNKKAIMKKGELDHVKSERNVLISTTQHPFLVSLHYSFQTADKLFFVMDYVNGGELFYHLQRDKKFSEDRARFYTAEIALAIGHLHSVGIVYRDLKPENILIGADGHVILTDFGLCKEGIGFGDSTATFCGTPEYLAPEVLRNEAHGLPVDWWCLGIVTYEMITGLPPFYSEDREQMYDRTLNEEVYYPPTMGRTAKDFIESMLQRDPARRLGSTEDDVEEVKRAMFFAPIDWDKLLRKALPPPWMPSVKRESDVTYVDPDFLAEPINTDVGSVAIGPLSSSVQANFAGFTFAEGGRLAATVATEGASDMDEALRRTMAAPVPAAV